VLASYNTGAGHVQDAQRLAEKYGGNPQSWEDVSYWLLQKSTQEYSTDPVVKFGFCRGLEPVNYVSHILERYDRYKQFLLARHGAVARPSGRAHLTYAQKSIRHSQEVSNEVSTASGSDRVATSVT
jgi:membrane-bound lytic murein transglycosylase F